MNWSLQSPVLLPLIIERGSKARYRRIDHRIADLVHPEAACREELQLARVRVQQSLKSASHC